MENIFLLESTSTGWMNVVFILTLCLLIFAVIAAVMMVDAEKKTKTIGIEVLFAALAITCLVMIITIVATQSLNRIVEREMLCKQVGIKVHCKLVKDR